MNVNVEELGVIMCLERLWDEYLSHKSNRHKAKKLAEKIVKSFSSADGMNIGCKLYFLSTLNAFLLHVWFGDAAEFHNRVLSVLTSLEIRRAYRNAQKKNVANKAPYYG